MGSLVNLIDLRIDGSGKSGRIPSFIGNLKSLKTFHMQGTNLEGPFPSSFSKLANLSEFRVSDLKLGIFPPLENMTLKGPTISRIKQEVVMLQIKLDIDGGEAGGNHQLLELDHEGLGGVRWQES